MNAVFPEQAVLLLAGQQYIDAALIYRTDVSGADLQAVSIPGGPEATYVIGALGAPRPEAQAWLDLLRGPEGQRILQARGFTPR